MPNGRSVLIYGSVASEPWWNFTRPPQVDSFSEYNQWKEARDSNNGRAIQILDGFRIEPVHEASDSDGSWISLLVDDEGRLIVGNEQTGILRITLNRDRPAGPASVEELNRDLEGIHGLAMTDAGLVANADGSRGLYLLPYSEGRDNVWTSSIVARNARQIRRSWSQRGHSCRYK